MKIPGCRLCWLSTCLAFALVLGCSPSDPANGTLTCGSGPQPCPAGFYCAGTNKCWKNNTGPDAGSSNSTGGSGGVTGGDDAGTTGGVLGSGGGTGETGDTPPSDVPLAGGDGDAAADALAAPECPTGEHTCGGQCVRNDDPSSCGNACSACPIPQGGTATCDGKSCAGSCPVGKVLCNGACVAQGTSCSGTCPTGTHPCNGLCLSSGDVTGCGLSCAVCPVPSGASQATCDGSKCGFVCNSGYHACGNTCARDDNPSACGASCTVCPADSNGVATCVAGGCSISCNAGYHYCPSVGKCLKDTDPGSCGISCTPCPAITGGVATCSAGGCGGSCPAGLKLCRGACIDSATACGGDCPAGSHLCGDLCASDTSTNSCGSLCAPCPAPEGSASVTCTTSGTCAFTCASGRHQCGSSCAADDDANACGSACKQCPADANGVAICQNGNCSVRCNSGYHNCNGTCVNNTALATCGLSECTGACQAPANGSVSCNGTACVQTCPNSLSQNCNGTCIAQNAACNGTCPNGQKYCSNSSTCIAATGTSCCTVADCPTGGANTVATCASNNCGLACSAGSYTKCGTDCFDLTSNDAHCGACGTSCGSTPSTPKCHSGSCVQCLSNSDCPGNKICQSNACVCPNTDSACDTACTACTGATPKCSSAGHCVQCTSDSNCGGNTPHCLLSSNTCVACTADAQCGTNKVCQSNQCVCAGNTPLDCGGTCIVSCVTGKACDAMSHTCVCSGSTPKECGNFCIASSACCSNLDCGTGKTCNASRQCVCDNSPASCGTGTSCTNCTSTGRTCDTGSGQCVCSSGAFGCNRCVEWNFDSCDGVAASGWTRVDTDQHVTVVGSPSTGGGSCSAQTYVNGGNAGFTIPLCGAISMTSFSVQLYFTGTEQPPSSVIQVQFSGGNQAYDSNFVPTLHLGQPWTTISDDAMPNVTATSAYVMIVMYGTWYGNMYIDNVWFK